jgi:cellulose synthase (UDP-forming)
MIDIIKKWLHDVAGKRDYQRYGEKEHRKERIAGQLFCVAVFVAGMYYLVWCVRNAQWQNWYMAVPFLVTEFLFLILFLLWANVLWNKRHHRPEGPPLAKIPYSVDIFIPVCGEQIDLITETVRAAAAIRYDQKKVFVLDDFGDERVQRLCAETGATYLRRPVHENRKAGNLNYGLAHSKGDLILALDADQVPDPEIVDRTIGYFSLPQIGFVQTRQTFILPEGDPWGNGDEVFYKVMQPGKDYDNAAISCGSGVIYRRSALESIGGFSTWNFVEDLHSSMLMHDKGWRSVYHGESYTRGTAPADVVSHTKQRWQWGVDSLRLFFWDNPLFRKGLDWNQKAQYFHFGYHYFVFGLFLPIFFIMPIWALFTHKFVLHEPFWRYLLARTPYLLLYMAANKITTDGQHSFKVFQAQAGLFAVYLHAAFSALRHRRQLPRYTVTDKAGRTPRAVRQRLQKCWPHLIIAILTVAAMIYGVYTIRNDSWFLAVNLFWAGWTLLVLSRFIRLSFFPKPVSNKGRVENASEMKIGSRENAGSEMENRKVPAESGT